MVEPVSGRGLAARPVTATTFLSFVGLIRAIVVTVCHHSPLRLA